MKNLREYIGNYTYTIVFVAVVLGWLYFSSDRTTWTDEVPGKLTGTWKSIEPSGEDRLIEITIESRKMLLRYSVDSEVEIDSYPIQRVSQDGETLVVIFFGKAHPKYTAEKIFEIRLRRENSILVSRIIHTGFDDSVRIFDVGEFVRLPSSP